MWRGMIQKELGVQHKAELSDQDYICKAVQD